MGRRARTNCSPIDSAMEKYHNDIGSRLSGVFMPPQPCLDIGAAGANTSTTDALNMFTLDMRSKAHNNHDNNMIINDTNNRNQNSSEQFQPTLYNDFKCEKDYSSCHCPVVSCQNSEKSQTLPNSLTQTPSLAMSVGQKTPESYSCGEDKEKRGLVDKLTRALFQRKHTCTRCQRKSKSCVPNKTFNSTDKHYMCGRCRETNHTMKNLVSGQSIPDNGICLTSPGESGDVILNKPRIHLKDSGYETVTSCSTVASSNSHHSTPKGSTKPHVQNSHVDDLIQRDNNTGTAPYNYNYDNVEDSNTHWLPVQTSYCNSSAVPALEQYMGVTGDSSSMRILKQVKNRYVENYDGYLPTNQNTQTSIVKGPAHPGHAATSSAEGAVDTSCDTFVDSSFCSTDQQCAHPRCTNSNKPEKVCYTCRTSSKPCFRLPWEGGWLCEDCLDGVY